MLGVDSSKKGKNPDDLKIGSLDFLIKLLTKDHLYHGLALLDASPQLPLKRMKPIPLVIGKNQPV